MPRSLESGSPLPHTIHMTFKLMTLFFLFLLLTQSPRQRSSSYDVSFALHHPIIRNLGVTLKTPEAIAMRDNATLLFEVLNASASEEELRQNELVHHLLSVCR